jgi:hypothetical protein
MERALKYMGLAPGMALTDIVVDQVFTARAPTRAWRTPRRRLGGEARSKV